MTTTGEITSHNNPNEMTSEISTIAPDLTLMAEPEKTISTEPKFGFFDRQMAELEPKVCLYINEVYIRIHLNYFPDRCLVQLKKNRKKKIMQMISASIKKRIPGLEGWPNFGSLLIIQT